MRLALSILGRELIAVTVGFGSAGEAPEPDLDGAPDYELGSDSTPGDMAEWRDDEDTAPLVIVRGDHKRGQTTRQRRNRPPIMQFGGSRPHAHVDVKPSAPRGFGFHI